MQNYDSGNCPKTLGKIVLVWCGYGQEDKNKITILKINK